MNKSMGLILSVTLLTSTLTTVNAEAKTIYKIKKGVLVNAKTDKVVKGFKNYKGKLYKNGKLFKGVYRDNFYSKGKKASGTYKGVKYHKGTAFTGKSVDGKYYKDGKLVENKEPVKPNIEDATDELVLVDGKLYVNPKTGIHYVRGKVQTKPYQYDEKTSKGYFFTDDGKLDTIFTNDEYYYYDLTDVLLSFHVYTNNQIEDVYMWEKERDMLLENINSLPDSNPKKYLQGEYEKATQVAINTYNKYQEEMKDKVNSLLEETDPFYFNEGEHKERLDSYLNEIDDEIFKAQVIDMINNAKEPARNEYF